MPDIHPFKAYRYNLPKSRLKQAVCPPYDIIGENQAEKLRRNKANAIHVELPTGSQDKKYQIARNVWKNWKIQRLVLQDLQPAYYVYEQIFSIGAKKVSRTGFFCELEIEEPGAGSVLRHELTLAKPVEDRLHLIRTLQVNSSPIFGLFSDPEGAARRVLERVEKQKPIADFRDNEKVHHRMWTCTDGNDQRVIRAAVQKNPVLIADGHHRYETAWNHSRENSRPGSQSTLFFLCPMEDPGLVIFPTHRIIKEPLALEVLIKKASALNGSFEVRKVGPPRQAPRPSSFVLSDGRKSYEVKPRDTGTIAGQFPGKPKEYQALSLAYVHQLLFPDLKKEDFLYSHNLRETLRLAKSKKTVAILVPPTTKEELYNIVRAGVLMPQKSTYFYPKVITGLVFRSLEE